jgi:hypothetical protein
MEIADPGTFSLVNQWFPAVAGKASRFVEHLFRTGAGA